MSSSDGFEANEAGDAGIRFSREQRAAIHALGNGGKLSLLTGVAGSGKTALLRPLVDAWHADGRTIVGMSTAWRQADALKDELYGGYVAKFLGDGVLAYFGWPMAYEDHAERAIRAGLAAIAAVGSLKAPSGAPLQARIGHRERPRGRRRRRTRPQGGRGGAVR